MFENDDKDEKGYAVGTGAKIVPEWAVTSDNQIVIIGIAVLGLLGLLFGWNSWRGGDDADLSGAALTEVVASGDEVVAETVDASVDLIDASGLAAVATQHGISAQSIGSVARLTGLVESESAKAAAGDAALAVTGITEVDNRLQIEVADDVTEPADLTPAVAAAVTEFGIDSSVTNGVVILEGVVPTQSDSAAAESAALGVAGVTGVDNRLTLIKPAVVTALETAGVAETRVEMDGTVAIARGFVDNTAAHDSAIEAAAAVPGVTSVTDELATLQPAIDSALTSVGVSGAAGSVADRIVTLTGELPSDADRVLVVEAAAAVPGITEVIDQMTAAEPDTVEVDLNALFELEPIQFASNAADILPESFATLDQAADILTGVTDRTFLVEGFTDVRGDEASNLALSQARAESVVLHLVNLGVADKTLSAVGYGETTDFGEGDSPEALALNRRVRFTET